MAPWGQSAAQERAGALAAGSYPFAAAVLGGSKSTPAGRKNLGEPVLTTIAPEASDPAMVLPARRTPVDRMLQSHEFTFGTGNRSHTGGKGLVAGSGMDLDAIKVRVSRDKVLVKAEWSFN
jgi:hypothetical protein